MHFYKTLGMIGISKPNPMWGYLFESAVVVYLREIYFDGVFKFPLFVVWKEGKHIIDPLIRIEFGGITCPVCKRGRLIPILVVHRFGRVVLKNFSLFFTSKLAWDTSWKKALPFHDAFTDIYLDIKLRPIPNKM